MKIFKQLGCGLISLSISLGAYALTAANNKYNLTYAKGAPTAKLTIKTPVKIKSAPPIKKMVKAEMKFKDDKIKFKDDKMKLKNDFKKLKADKKELLDAKKELIKNRLNKTKGVSIQA